ncbi:MAG TPA: biotin/lipoate A/B protein ligase family protein [Spirochaetales bacterium]|nr:biotin/lipoate A/B protein ligase family protein [Spirochaetales bacterium]HRV28489.1 biotin/lipoate A/B protein ligase family protein [Spirochaetia bacterium]
MRLLTTGFNSAYWNMSVDEAILEMVASNAVEPTLRFYGWQPHAISIGYFQGIEEEVDREACKRMDIDIVRRITGGGAVFHADELTYSIVIPETHYLACHDILKSYESILQGVINGFNELGLQAEFAPINDIIINNKKVSGNAQTRKYGCILQHGTILISVEPETMFTLLKVPNEKLKGKLIADIKERVTSIRALLGTSVSFESVQKSFIQGFARLLKEPLIEGSLTHEELERARILQETKFGTEAWNNKRL